MAAIADLTAYQGYVNGGVPQRVSLRNKIIPSTVSGRLMSSWLQTPFAGAAPTTAAAPTRATTGALGQQNAGTTQLWPVAFDGVSLAGGVGQQSSLILCDRLSHQGGLSGIVTTAQTTNLPTAALTRYTTGDGVWLGVEIYTAVGATGTTITASYTNQAGTAGRTTRAVVFGGTGFNNLSRMILLPLADGDTGVQSVQSVTVLATTGTAGAFGVTLFKPLLVLPVGAGAETFKRHVLNNGFMPLVEVLDDACLFWVTVVSSGLATNLTGDLLLAEV